jgi:hypothetical protein
MSSGVRANHIQNIFREARLTAEFSEATQPDRGNIARIIRRLGEALEKTGQKEEAAELHAEAEKIRKEMQDTKYSAKDDTEEAYNRLVAEYAYYYRRNSSLYILNFE